VRKYELFLSLRYLRSRKLNIICVLAVAVCVTVLIVVLSVMWGFDRRFQGSIRGTLSDIYVTGPEGMPIGESRPLAQDIEAVPGVEATAPYVEQLYTGASHRGLALTVTVRGIDMQRELRVGKLGSYLTRTGKSADFNRDGQSPPLPGAILGSELYRELAVIPGSTIQLVSPWGDVDDVPAQCTVVGKFKTGMYEYDRTLLYIPLAAAQRAFGLGQRVSGISVALKRELRDDYRKADQVKEQIADLLGPNYRVDTWRDDERVKVMLGAVVTEQWVMAIIEGFTFLLAATTIIATLTMSVKEKTRDIGILRSLGARTRGIMMVFLVNGLLIGLVGSALGLTAGLLIDWKINPLADAVAWIKGSSIFPPEVYYLEEIPTYLDPAGAAAILCIAVGTSVLAALIPALMAARLDPIQALRYE